MPAKQSKYGTTAKAFHWVIVGLIAVQLPLGWLMPDIRRGMTLGSAMSLHISIGITLLVLIVLRLPDISGGWAMFSDLTEGWRTA